MINPTKRSAKLISSYITKLLNDKHIFLEQELHKRFAWHPVKLSSGRWVFGKHYWVRYQLIMALSSRGSKPLFMQGDPLEKLSSEEALMRRLSE